MLPHQYRCSITRSRPRLSFLEILAGTLFAAAAVLFIGSIIALVFL